MAIPLYLNRFKKNLKKSKKGSLMLTIVNVIPQAKWLTIEAHNEHCFVRVAEPNNHIIYRLIKTSVKLYIKTAVKLLKKVFK